MHTLRITLDIPIRPDYDKDEKLVKLVNDSLDYYNKPIDTRGKLPKEDIFFSSKFEGLKRNISSLEIIKEKEDVPDGNQS